MSDGFQPMGCLRLVNPILRLGLPGGGGPAVLQFALAGPPHICSGTEQTCGGSGQAARLRMCWLRVQ
jgi:hypothetical protein